MHHTLKISIPVTGNIRISDVGFRNHRVYSHTDLVVHYSSKFRGDVFSVLQLGIRWDKMACVRDESPLLYVSSGEQLINSQERRI